MRKAWNVVFAVLMLAGLCFAYPASVGSQEKTDRGEELDVPYEPSTRGSPTSCSPRHP